MLNSNKHNNNIMELPCSSLNNEEIRYEPQFAYYHAALSSNLSTQKSNVSVIDVRAEVCETNLNFAYIVISYKEDDNIQFYRHPVKRDKLNDPSSVAKVWEDIRLAINNQVIVFLPLLKTLQSVVKNVELNYDKDWLQIKIKSEGKTGIFWYHSSKAVSGYKKDKIKYFVSVNKFLNKPINNVWSPMTGKASFHAPW